MPPIQGARGLFLEAPAVFAARELPPLQPGPGEVVVEVAGCGLCRTGRWLRLRRRPHPPPTPLILGHEISGRVVAAGEHAESWAAA
jgi:6-hydroxycyclohex-1-ene-1-carbonyl-CoA dehydrogenase